MTCLHFTPSPSFALPHCQQNNTQNTIDRKEMGEHKDFSIFLPCHLSTEYSKAGWREMPLAQFLLLSTLWSSGRHLKFNMPHLPVIIQKHLHLIASLTSQSCHHSTIKTLGLPLAPSYAGMKPQLVPSDFNSFSRASQNTSFFPFPLFGLRVKEWAGIVQTNIVGSHSEKQNSLHQNLRWHTRKLLVT